MALERKEAENRVNRCLDAIDTLLCLGRGTINHFKQQHKLFAKAKKEFENALDGLFSPDDVKTYQDTQPVSQQVSEEPE